MSLTFLQALRSGSAADSTGESLVPFQADMSDGGLVEVIVP